MNLLYAFDGIKTSAIIALVLAIIFTVLLLIFILPEKKRGKLTKAFRAIHDFFNIKGFWIEGIAKFFFVFTALFSVFIGICLIFTKHVSFGISIGLIVLGPIVARISYEGVMMLLMLVRNTMDIRNHLKGITTEKKEPADAEAVVGNVISKIKNAVEVSEESTKEENAAVPPQPTAKVCRYCGSTVEDDAHFCEKCGKPIEE